MWKKRIEGKKMAVISIVVPVYNAKKSLKRCLESLIHQTYKQLEIILIDDGSTDGSGEMCNEYASQDQRIIVIHKENEGVSAARNTGIERATGTYLQFVDSDDYLDLDACEILVKAIEENQSEMVICGCVEHREKEKKVIVPLNKPCQDLKQMGEEFGKIYSSNLLNIPWNKLFIKEKVRGKFEDEISLGEDLLFNIAYMDNINKITFLDAPLYHYMIEKTSLSRKFREDYVELNLILCNKVMEFASKNIDGENGEGEINRYFMISLLRGAGIMLCDSNRNEKEKKVLLKKWLLDKKICESVNKAVVYGKKEKLCKSVILKHQFRTLYFILKLKQIVRK